MADGANISAPHLPLTEPGWYDLSEDVYHEDPCPEPSLSASAAKTIIGSTVMHAWRDHPKSPFDREPIAKKIVDVGKAVHAMVFGGARIVVIEHDSYQKKAAKEARDKAYADGCIPILEKQISGLEEMATLAQVRFADLYGEKFYAERVAIWKCPRANKWRRGMLDTSSMSAPIIVDYKTTEASVSDEACIRRIYDQGLHIQSAAYEEAMEQLNPEWAGRVKFYFQWQEQKAPYALSRPILMPEAGITLGREQWAVAGGIWDAAQRLEKFPGYGVSPIEANPPPWEITRWEDRMATDETLNAGAA